MLRKNLLYRIYFYFREGYRVFISFPVAVFNFIVIQYTLLIERISFLKILFPRLLYFILIVVPILFVVAVLLGRYRYKKGMFSEEAYVQAMRNPITQKILKRLDKIEKELRELKELIKERH